MESCHILKCLLANIFLVSTSVFAQSSRIDSLKNILNNDISDSLRMEIYNEMGEITFRVNYEESIEYSKKALQIAGEKGYKKRIVEFRKNVGDTYRTMGDYKLAEQYFSLNLSDAKKLSDTLVLRGAYQNLGGVYINLAQFDTAIYFLTEAANLASATNDEVGVAGIYANIGLALVSNNETDKALDYLQQSLKLYEEMGNAVQVAGGNLRIARVYLNLKDNETALKYGLIALESAERAGNKAMLATACSEVSTSYLNLGRFDDALALTEKSLAIKREMGNKRGIASCLYTLGSIRIEKGNYSLAEKYLYEALGMLKEMGAREQVMESYKALSGLYKKNAQYKEALAFLQDYTALRDSILNEQNLKQIASLETQFQVKEKERELEMHKIRLSVQEDTLRKQKIMLIGGVLIIVLTITLLFLLFRNLNQRKKVNKQLKELDEAKSRFFANISHELRTPLTLILAPLQNLTNRCRDNASLFELKLIGSNAKKLLELTDEVMELSKLESGTIRLNKSAVNINDLCRRIFFTYQSLAQFRRIGLDFHSDFEDGTTVVFDINKIEKILNNLIMNAFKYSFSDGLILFSIKRSGKELLFSIKDNGQGIHPNDLPNIFNRYYQSGQKGQAENGGAGIGLALSSEYARLSGGSLNVESEWGKGSEFVLSIPYELAREQLEPGDYTKVVNTEGEIAPIMYPSVFKDKKPSILVVEDNLEMSRFLVSILSAAYSCKQAPDGLQAMMVMENERFDLILSDIMMPNMDGFEFREKVMQQEEWKLTPFVILTARTPEEDKIKGFQLGVDDYITKPFHPNELLARIGNLLVNKSKRDAWRDKNREQDQQKEDPTLEEKFLLKAEKLVRDHLDDTGFSTSELASGLAYSQRQLERLLKKYTGLSPNAFIREIRLNKAYQLLDKKQFATVVEVCYNVGFDNPSYFSRKFFERFGRKPSEF